MTPLTAELLIRSLEPAGGTRFWAAPPNEYRIELWDASGRPIRTLAAKRDWFEPWHSIARVTPSREVPPPSNLHRIEVDADGLLWVFLGRAADTWRDSFTGEVDVMGQPLRDPEILLTGVIEVIDPEAGVVLARRTVPARLVSAGAGRVYRFWEDERGLPRVEVSSLRLVGR